MNLFSFLLKLTSGSKSECWITTYTGQKFYPIRPEVDQIKIEDIAHALSNICRFTGHCNDFYSVAQHVVLVSYLCDEEDDFDGLNHDDEEAYICDIARPLKIMPAFFIYRIIEKNIHRTISQKFNLKVNIPKSVKIADSRILGNEMKSLMNIPKEHYMKYNPYEWIPHLTIDNMPESKKDIVEFRGTITPWNNKKAEIMFLNRFYQLQNKRKSSANL